MKRNLSVLVVDDHPGIRTGLADILEAEGFVVATASSGKEAINEHKKENYDVVLMDVRMPDISGIEVYRRIYRHSTVTRVIMMSAYPAKDLEREILLEGASVVAFLQKPLDVELMLRLIRRTGQPPTAIGNDYSK